MSSPSEPQGEARPEAGFQIIRAKLGVPRARLDMVSRPRLLDRLDAGASRVVLVSAPAGSGKTVLIQDWLRETGAPAAWFSLDTLDNEPARFLAHFGAALRMVDRPGMQEAAAAAEALARNGGDPARSLLPAFSMAEEEAVLVLDDCHLLEARDLVTFLEGLMTEIRTGPRLVLLSRVDPPVPLGRLRLSGDLLEIRQRDLRFSGEEAVELFHRALSVSLPAELVARLEERTEGWAAGLRMAAIALQQAEDPEEAAEAFAGSHELLVDYLLEEAVHGQPPEIQRFLMETSILPRFTAEGCAAVTEDPEAWAHLRAVDEANLFLVTLDPRQDPDASGRWFRYHHLFAELLRFRLQDTFPERVEGLHERASRWFEARGDIQEALAQAAEMESPRRLLELLDVHGYPILARSEFASFARWLGRVPQPLSQPYPMFLAALAWFRAQTERAPELDDLLGALEAILQDPPSDYPADRLQEARLHLAALRPFAYRVTDRFDLAVASAEEALATLPPGAVTMRGVLEFNTGAVHLRLANMDQARRYLEKSHESCLKGRVPYLVLAGLGHRGNVAANTEGLPAARRRLESAMAFARERGLAGVPAFAIILYQLAQVHILAHELEKAGELLRRALDLTRGERDTDIHANVLIHLARVAVGEGAFHEAEEHLNTASALAFSSNVKPYATTLDVEWARLNESRHGRLQVPEEAPPSAETSGFWTSWTEAETVLQLQHCLQLGRREEAAELAGRLKRESEPRQRGLALLVAEVARAALAPQAAERKEILSAALAMASTRGYIMPLVQGGPPVRALLEAGLSYPLPPVAQAFVRERILPLMPGKPSEAGFPPGVLTPPEFGSPPGVGSPSSLPESEDWDLTEKEVEVLTHLSRGLTNAAMARELFVSVNTVKTHLKNIYSKLDVTNRTEAVRAARRRGLVPPDEG